MSSVTSDSLVEGRFQLREIIGEGGMARVYAAYDKRLLRNLAIKILNPEFARRDSIRRRFLQEARTMATLDDPRVVRIIDYGEEGDRVYIIMELVDGGSLLERVRDHGPLPPRMAAQVTLELCRALEKAHSMGIRHRDVKPHNVLLTREGSIRITDFGIAQVERDDGHGMTRTGAVMGTWGYMAPEQKTDASSVDDRADIYATGATLWALLRAETPPELFMADSEPSMLEGVPDVLAEVIRRSTRYRRDERYPTIRAMADSLGALLPLLPDDPADAPPLVPARLATGRSSAVDTMIQLGAAEGAPARPPSIATSSGSGMPPHEPTLIPSGRGTLVADDAMEEPPAPHPLPASNFRAAPTVAVPPPAAPVSPAAVAPAPRTQPPAWEPPEPEPPVASNGKALAIVAVAAVVGAVLIGVLWLAFGPDGTAKDAPTGDSPPPVTTATPPPADPASALTTPPAPTAAEVPGVPPAAPVGAPSAAPSGALPPAAPTTAPSAAPAPAATPPAATPAPSTTPSAPPAGTAATEPTTPPVAATAPPTTPPATAPDPTTTPVDPNSATLVFTPPGSAHVGDSVVFRASIGTGWEVKLFYRAKGSTTWLEKLLVAREGAYSATLRVDDAMAGGVEYFIEASRGSAKVRQGRYSAPLLLDVQP